MITNCECKLAGFCARHNVKKNAHWHSLCQSKPRYFDAWERGEGPGQRTEMPEPIQGPRYNHWAPLHWYAVEHADDWKPKRAKQFYRAWMRAIPELKGCGCKRKWIEMGIEFDFSSPQAFFESAWRGHNTVNAEIGKPTVGLCDCYAEWWPERMTNRCGLTVGD
jgi:hypothetical protein